MPAPQIPGKSTEERESWLRERPLDELEGIIAEADRVAEQERANYLVRAENLKKSAFPARPMHETVMGRVVDECNGVVSLVRAVLLERGGDVQQ